MRDRGHASGTALQLLSTTLAATLIGSPALYARCTTCCAHTRRTLIRGPHPHCWTQFRHHRYVLLGACVRPSRTTALCYWKCTRQIATNSSATSHARIMLARGMVGRPGHGGSECCALQAGTLPSLGVRVLEDAGSCTASCVTLITRMHLSCTNGRGRPHTVTGTVWCRRWHMCCSSARAPVIVIGGVLRCMLLAPARL